MVETQRALTIDEFARLPSGMGLRYELVNGELRTMTAAGLRRGMIVAQIGGLLLAFVVSRRLGIVCGAETGFVLHRQPNHLRAPDVAFVSREYLPPLNRRDGFLEAAPDLVVEVVSPGDTWTEVSEKALDWLEHGVRIVWVVDPGTLLVAIWRSPGQVEHKRGDEEVDAEPVLPGFRCLVSDFFAQDVED